MSITIEDVLRQLEPGTLYYLRTLSPPQRLEREHVLTYLGKVSGTDNLLQFNARPFAGTQEINSKEITAIRRMVRTDPFSREDPQHFMNRVYRGGAGAKGS